MVTGNKVAEKKVMENGSQFQLDKQVTGKKSQLNYAGR